MVTKWWGKIPCTSSEVFSSSLLFHMFHNWASSTDNRLQVESQWALSFQEGIMITSAFTFMFTLWHWHALWDKQKWRTNIALVVALAESAIRDSPPWPMTLAASKIFCCVSSYPVLVREVWSPEAVETMPHLSLWPTCPRRNWTGPELYSGSDIFMPL